MNIKRIAGIIAIFFFIGLPTVVNAQSSQLNYCKSEVEQLEKKIENLNKLMLAQSTEVFELKKQIIELRKVNKLTSQENEALKEVSVNMINIAIKFEQQAKYEEALQIYKLLIKSYPTSLEAAASRVQIEDLRHTLKK